jgi:hypothetical protein
MYEKLVLGYSPLTEEIYLGKTNPKKPNEWLGDKKNITNNFIQVMLQKFEPNTETTIKAGGEPKYKIIVIDNSRDLYSKEEVLKLLEEQRQLCAKELGFIKLESMEFPLSLHPLQEAIKNLSTQPKLKGEKEN